MKSNWTIEQNGISVADLSGKQIIDLHNECEVVDLRQGEGNLEITFKKVSDYIHSDEVKEDELIRIKLGNVDKVSLPEYKFPVNFEGIYDATNSSLSLCLEDECTIIPGQDIQIIIETPTAKPKE